MSEKIVCSDCNETLTAPPPADHPVCPKCGSKKLLIHYTLRAEPGSFRVTLRRDDVLLQTVIERGEKRVDGDLIIAVLPAWRKILSILKDDPAAAFKIDARKWEEIIAASYEEAGFDEVILTPRSGDLGRDIIAVKYGFWTVRIIDQVKAYGPDHRVPANDVRALLGVLQADRAATKGLVTTTSEFAPMIATDPLIAPFIPHRLQLVNGKELLSRLALIADGQYF